MKIKTWLLITYLLAMIVPLFALYGLYVSINAYYQDKNVEEYFDKWNALTDIKPFLENPTLYSSSQDFTEIEALVSEQLMITLYGPSGRVLYSTNPFVRNSNFETRNNLYKNLFEFKQNFETFVYKEPVYQDGKIIGIYKVTLARTEWVDQVNSKTILVISSLVVVLLVLYIAVIYFLNIRLNRPTKKLMQQMRAFAKGQQTEHLPIKSDEIGELTASFQAMQHEIQATRKQLDAEQQQKEFIIASLSHDLKTPLTSIQAYTESLRGGTLSPSVQQEYLDVISSKSDYMKQLLDDLMMFTLLQSPSYEMERVIVDGEEFFDMLLDDYEEISKEKGFIATTMIHVSARYNVNPKQLMRVLDNIISNAWTHTNPGGTIQVAAFEPPHIPHWCDSNVSSYFTQQQGVYIIVQNSGETIEHEFCEKMFEPLYQIDQSRSQLGQRGAGLGLSIAKQIIEKHDGTIQAISKNLKTAIICWLPKEKEQ